MFLDAVIFRLINGLTGKWWFFDLTGIFFAEYFGYFLAVFAVFLVLKEKKIRQKIYFFSLIAISLILSRGIVVETIRFFYGRVRPFAALKIEPLISHAANGSFPSGHATMFFSLAFSIFLFYRENNPDSRLGFWFLAGAALISFARIFAGVHWPSDILAGALIGLISVFLVKKLLDFENARNKIKNESTEVSIN